MHFEMWEYCQSASEVQVQALHNIRMQWGCCWAQLSRPGSVVGPSVLSCWQP